jgi:hypothetical protein
MSERKGHGNRGSLMDLAKPRLAHSPLSAPIDEAERLILARQPEPTTPPGTGEASEPRSDHDHRLETAQRETGSLPEAPAPKSIPAGRVQSRASRRPERSPEEDLVARLRKTREPIAVVGFKLPATLKDELSAVAQYNGTDMTRIVVEALHRLLPELPHPPGWN